MARPKQGFLEGTEPEVIPEIESAADDYVDVRDRRMELTKKEVKNKSVLQGAMEKHKLKSYQYGDKTVQIIRGEPKLKVKATKEKKKRGRKPKGGEPAEANGEI